MNTCKPVATSLAQNKKVSKDDDERLYDATQFGSLVGNLLYLTTTRLDLMLVTGYLSRFISSPWHVHFGIVKRVLKYLKGIVDYGIWYEVVESLNLIGYSNNDQVEYVDDAKGIFGYVFSFGLRVFSWC